MSGGELSRRQIESLRRVLESPTGDSPALLADLAGAGPVARLEEELTQICGAKYVLAVSSGTAAVHAALLAAGVRPGDEVVVPSYSWPQTVSPVLHLGAVPVFADIDPDTLNPDPESVRQRISSQTRAIVVVHLFGQPAEMKAMRKIAREARVPLIADAAQALGAGLHGRPVAAWADLTCFSLGRGKLVSAGEGGFLAGHRKDLLLKAVALTQHPQRLHRLTGRLGHGLALNYRLHPLAALLALAELEGMKEKLDHRLRVHRAFWEGVGEDEELRLPETIPGAAPAPYALPIIFQGGYDRRRLVVAAQGEGVPLTLGPVGRPLHRRVRAWRRTGPIHPSWQRGACSRTEEHCARRELLALSALDMDRVGPEEARRMGQALRRIHGQMEKYK